MKQEFLDFFSGVPENRKAVKSHAMILGEIKAYIEQLEDRPAAEVLEVHSTDPTPTIQHNPAQPQAHNGTIQTGPRPNALDSDPHFQTLLKQTKADKEIDEKLIDPNAEIIRREPAKMHKGMCIICGKQMESVTPLGNMPTCDKCIRKGTVS